MTRIKGSVPLLVVTLACFAIGLWAYPKLPDFVPSHWNTRGEVDAYSSKTFAVFFFPALILAMYFLFIILPSLDPKKEKYQQFAGTYSMIRAVILLILNALYLITIFVGLGYSLNVALLVKLSVSLLFVAIGDQIGRVKQNWFVGFRTPWTLSSEENWRKTHRFGARTMVVGAILSLFVAPFNGAMAATAYFVLIMGGALAPVIYSYVLFRQGT